MNKLGVIHKREIDRFEFELLLQAQYMWLDRPFRDGNGRIARWLADLMALQARYPLPNYGFTGPGAPVRRRRYLEAVQQGYVTDYAALADFFVEAITRRFPKARS